MNEPKKVSDCCGAEVSGGHDTKGNWINICCECHDSCQVKDKPEQVSSCCESEFIGEIFDGYGRCKKCKEMSKAIDIEQEGLIW